MNYNPNAGLRNPQGPIRKPKRVSDVNAMGPAAPMSDPMPYMQPAAGQTMLNPTMGGGGSMGGFGPSPGPQAPSNMAGGFNNGGIPMQSQNYSYAAPPPTSQPNAFPTAGPGPQQQYMAGSPAPAAASQYPNAAGGQYPNAAAGQYPNAAAGQYPNAPAGQYPNAAAGQYPNATPQFAMFQQPIVQDMAMQYGQRLADQGKQLMENQFERWVPVAKLKYYFAVDNKYVINKLRLLFFPFTHKDWSLKYDQENPVQPRYDINAPDLYIPTMAYITYVVVAGLMLGMQKRFSPEQLGIQASSALAYSLFELLVYSITLYVVNIKTSLKTLDLLAFSGYKYVIVVASLLVSTLFNGFGYYMALIYTSLTLGFFLLRTLKTKVLHDPAPTTASGVINYDPYGNPQQLDYTGGRKRKLYFLFLIVGGQAFISFLLSKHLYLPDAATLEIKNSQF